MSEREKLLSFLFDRTDKRVLNVKFFRGTAKDLTIEELCRVAREVIEDTWSREGSLEHLPPQSSALRTPVHAL